MEKQAFFLSVAVVIPQLRTSQVINTSQSLAVRYSECKVGRCDVNDMSSTAEGARIVANAAKMFCHLRKMFQ